MKEARFPESSLEGEPFFGGQPYRRDVDPDWAMM